MKYICLGYYNKDTFDKLPEAERNAMIDACFTYDDHLRDNGHYAHGYAVQPPENTLALAWRNGKVAATDGPFTETREQLGGIIILEARDMNHAAGLISQHPSLHYGSSWEIRPVGDMSEMEKESNERRQTISG